MNTNVLHSEKNRYWGFIAYPESAPANWLEILGQTGLPIAISPLHDKDVQEDGGTPKKAHYHVLLVWSGPTTRKTAQRIAESVNGANVVAIRSVKGNYRYFTHKDDPDKFQYSETDIQVLNGFNVMDVVDLEKSEVLAIKVSLIDLIEDLDITEYQRLIQVVRHAKGLQELDVAMGNTFFFNSYISSRRNIKKGAV